MTLDFNNDWLFCREGEPPHPVCLPHDAMILEERRADCRNGVNSGFFPGGVYRYEKRFSLSAAEAAGSVTLHFEGVYHNCTVTCNRKRVGRHRYGFTPFDVELSGVAAVGENTLSVRVDNSLEPNCRWYTGSGIFRPVQLLLRDRRHIESVHVETVEIDPPQIRVTVQTTDGSDATVQIFDGDRLLTEGQPGVINVPDAGPWSAESPQLYTCVVRTGTDERRLLFGIRKLSWSAKTGLLINGTQVKLRGGCIHHDHGILGACEFAAAEERRLRILKENGFNAVRISHHPASQITLGLCDKLGLYVMNETFDGWYTPKTYHDYARWFDEDWQSDVTAMVESSRNHPSVIIYSVGNEVSETATEKGGTVCRELTQFVHGLDPTRPVTAGINVLLNVYARMGLGVYQDKGEYKPEPLPSGTEYREKKTGSAFFNAVTSKLGKLLFFMSKGMRGDKACQGAEALDILGLNYASSQYDYQVLHHPERMMVGSETMAADLPYNWERVLKYPQLIGDFVWSAWDYLGEACIGDWTYHSYPGLPLLAGQGMIDITGKPLAAMAFMQVVWGLRKEPYIGVRPLNHAGETPSKGAWQFTNAVDSWSWAGYEGIRATVEVYSRSPVVRLLLNGKTVATKKTRQYKALFRLPYAPGTLTAQAADEEGHTLAQSSLQTGGAKTVLTVTTEKETMAVGGQDHCYLPIEFTDEKGTLKPYIEQPVKITVAGPAVLAGFGSALCKTNEGFQSNVHMAYRGCCLAVLRSGMEKGTVAVAISSSGVPTVTKHIAVE